MPDDHLAALTTLPGVAEAAAGARAAVDRLAGQRVLRTDATAVRVEIAWRAVVASAALADVDISLDDVRAGALPEGSAGEYARAAMRVSAELEALGPTWTTAPRQALARLHALAAADLVDDDERLGRPRPDPEVGPRLELLADLVTGGTKVPAFVLAAVAHGELLTLAPFGVADGVVARAVSRLITMSSGLDPHGLGVPEMFWMKQSGNYRAAARGFASGTPNGLGAWLVLSNQALHAGAREALQIAQAAG